MKLLVVEDDPQIRAFVSRGLEQEGFVVDQAGDGESGLEMALHPSYDAAVMDILLPGRDGLSVIEQMRTQGVRTPVLILSALRSVDERVEGLRRGGDDYLTKPFSFAELLARVEALLRRGSSTAEPTRLAAGDLVLDRLERWATRSGRVLDLQPKEFALLELLLSHPGRPVSRTMILEKLWGYHFDPQTNVVDVLVSRLRAKVDRGCDRRAIRTMRGVGYVVDRA
jgi:DNA-binding response OmpR family regulator